MAKGCQRGKSGISAVKWVTIVETVAVSSVGMPGGVVLASWISCRSVSEAARGLAGGRCTLQPVAFPEDGRLCLGRREHFLG